MNTKTLGMEREQPKNCPQARRQLSINSSTNRHNADNQSRTKAPTPGNTQPSKVTWGKQASLALAPFIFERRQWRDGQRDGRKKKFHRMSLTRKKGGKHGFLFSNVDCCKLTTKRFDLRKDLDPWKQSPSSSQRSFGAQLYLCYQRAISYHFWPEPLGVKTEIQLDFLGG